MAQSNGKSTIPAGYGAATALRFSEIMPPRFSVPVPSRGVGIFCGRLPPNEWPEHQHEATQILIALKSGQCAVTWRTPSGRKVRRTLGENEVWIIPPGVRHGMRWLNEAGIILLYLSAAWLTQFDQEALASVAIVSLPELTLRDPLIGALTNALQQLFMPPVQPHAGQVAAIGHCLAARLQHGLAICRTGPHRHQRQLGDEAMKRITAHVEQNLGDHITMAGLAREARLSPGHFGVLFKATIGMNPEQYILRMRLMKAKGLIGTGAHTVAEVAHMTGFYDHSHLSVQFKRLFGSPPKSYMPRILKT